MLHTRTALLLALRRGPSYGSELKRRVHDATGGALRLGQGSLHPALQQLERAGLVRSWSVVPGRRRGGRARRYCELTERGMRASEAACEALLALLGVRSPGPGDSSEEIDARRRRLELAGELGEALIELAEGSQPGSRKGSA